MVGKVAATYAVKTADIRARPGGVQIVFELLPKAPYATRYRIIDEIETVARSIGYGALRMPIDPETGIGDIEGTTIRMTFPYPPTWPYVVRQEYADRIVHPVLGRPPYEDSGLQSKEVSL